MIEKFKIMKWDDNVNNRKTIPMTVDDSKVVPMEVRSDNVIPMTVSGTEFGMWKDGKWVSFEQKNVKDILQCFN